LPNYVPADLNDAARVGQLVAGCDVVIHAAGLAHRRGAAAHDAAEFERVNVRGTETVARAAAAAECRRLILVSSVSVYGGGSPAKSESSPCRPASPYACSKLAGEEIAAAVAENAGMEFAALRMATLYGPGDPGNVGRLFDAVARRRFVWIGDGSNAKSLVHVDDAANACVGAARREPWPGSGAYNVSTPPASMRHIVASMAAACGRRPPTLRAPAWLVRRLAAGAWREALDKWLADDIYDGSLFSARFHWWPMMSLHEGLNRQAIALDRAA
jgi:nucleoside-diphosphate-sugar epimerase